MRKLYLIFVTFSLLFFNKGFANGSILDSLEQRAKLFPKELIQELEEKKDLSLTHSQEQYLLAFASENIGDIQHTDSILKVIDLEEIKQESDILYFKFSLLAARYQKLLGEYENAYLILRQTFEFLTERADTVQLITTHISLAELYRASYENKLGLLELKKAEKLIYQFKKHPLEAKLAYLYNRKAALSPNDSVESLSLKSLALARKVNDLDLIATACNELGAFYYNQKKISPKSKTYLKEAIKIWDSLGYDIYATGARVNLSRYYNRTSENEQSLQVLLPIKDLVDQSSWVQQKASYYEMLGRAYARLGRYKEAYLNKRLSKKYLSKNEKALQQRIAIYAYELDVQEKEKQIELTQLKLSNEKTEKTTLYIVIFGIILVVLLVSYFYFKLKRNNRKISTQRNLLEQQTTTISESNTKLNDLLTQKETLLKEVNHRVKNNLTVLSSLLNLQANSEENKHAQEALQDSQLRIQSIALIHESLYQKNNDQLDFKIYLENLFNRIQSLYWNKPKAVVLDITLNNYQPSFKESIPIGMILNELITNSFKYAFQEIENPCIYIKANEHSISYCDNGPGFDHESNSTLGLRLISIFAIQLNATLSHQEWNGMKQTLIEWE